MNAPTLTIDIVGLAEAQGSLQRIRNGLADRRSLHQQMAREATTLTAGWLAKDTRHKTASRLGATPTGHRKRAGTSVEPASDAEAAIIRIPRRTGLGRAFSDMVIKPGSGKTYLTLPACKETYGKTVRDFGADAFRFVLYKGKTAALVWKKDGGSHEKGKVAYWLKKEVFQRQDRTLLPPDEAYRELARQRVIIHVASLLYRADTATSTPPPSA